MKIKLLDQVFTYLKPNQRTKPPDTGVIDTAGVTTEMILSELRRDEFRNDEMEVHVQAGGQAGAEAGGDVQGFMNINAIVNGSKGYAIHIKKTPRKYD